MQSEPIRVLLVEDNVPYAVLLQDHLAHAAGRFDVTHVERMAEAVRRLQDGDFDAVCSIFRCRTAAAWPRSSRRRRSGRAFRSSC